MHHGRIQQVIAQHRKASMCKFDLFYEPRDLRQTMDRKGASGDMNWLSHGVRQITRATADCQAGKRRRRSRHQSK